MGNIAIKDFANSKVLSQMMLYERRIENSMYRTMDQLKKIQSIRKAEDAAAEKQAKAANQQSVRQFNVPTENENEVKKQSQFVLAREGLKSFVEGGYGNKSGPGPQENKANLSPRDQSQSRAPARPKRVGGIHCQSRVEGRLTVR